MEPATSIVARLGGPGAVSQITGVNVSNVHRWTYPRERGGTNGVIPLRHWSKLIKFASERNIDLTATDLAASAQERGAT